MGLDKSKVLRMSVKKYCDLKLVSPKDYNFVGVHAFSDKYSSGLQGSINLDYYFRIHNIPESVQQYQGEGSYSRLEFKTYTPLEDARRTVEEFSPATFATPGTTGPAILTETAIIRFERMRISS